ncbi:MAG TPA: DUF481 domain-containing protein [Bdellovibrionota bacterium]|nr:DUF481 domain-containing protein [Bdellovibrionota bacterium]
MKIILILFLSISHLAQAAENKLGLTNESEAGVVIAGGNAESQSYSLRQTSQNRWENDAVRFDGRFLKSSSRGFESARNWLLGLRYERNLVDDLSGFAGLSVESDVFAGFLQRYNIDVGAKYYFLKEDAFSLFSEAGYRRMIENRFTGQLSQNALRFYTEGDRDWTKTFATKIGVEYLPNLTISSDYQLNLDLSASAAISDVFALKAGYLVKYRKIPAAPATKTTDTQFTTAIVAKF